MQTAKYKMQQFMLANSKQHDRSVVNVYLNFIDLLAIFNTLCVTISVVTGIVTVE